MSLTRGRNQLIYRFESFESSPKYMTPNIYFELPVDLISIDNLKQFRH